MWMGWDGMRWGGVGRLEGRGGGKVGEMAQGRIGVLACSICDR
jgi:hypothetical protein